MQHVVGMGQAALRIAQQALEAQLAASNAQAAKLQAVARANHNIQKAKAKAAAEALEEGEGAENFVTGAAVSCAVLCLPQNHHHLHLVLAQYMKAFLSDCRVEMMRTQNCTLTTGPPDL